MSHIEIYEACYPSLVRCYGEDAAQDAGERLVTHPPNSDNPRRIKAWLHVVARHAQVTALRHSHRERVSTEDDPTPSVDPRSQIEARLALQELPRDVVHAICETMEAPNMGTSTKAVKLHRLRKRLREQEAPAIDGVSKVVGRATVSKVAPLETSRNVGHITDTTGTRGKPSMKSAGAS